MKKFTKLLGIVLILTLVMSMGTMALAEELPAGTKGAEKTITITPPSGVDEEVVSTYTVYKVFNATTNGTAISYKSLDGTAPEGFVVDDANNVYLGTATDEKTGAAGEFEIKVEGNTKYIVPSTASELTAAQIDAIAAYTGKVEVGTVTITGNTETTVTLPDYGYYYITTSTGTAVTINSTKPSATVQDKNVITPPEKKITGVVDLGTGTVNEGSFDEDGQKALAQLGSKVEYEATVTKSHGAKNYVFHDVMGTGLTYNNDVKVYNGETEVVASATTFDTTTASGDTITITFVDSYIQGLPDGTVLTIKYSATVNSDALTVDTGKNTASLSYGDNNQVVPSPNTPVVYNAKFTVTKKDGDNKALAGAGFVIAKSVTTEVPAAEEGGEATTTTSLVYYKLTAATDTTSATVSWVDSIDDATEYTSDSAGAVTAFTGLADGTYTLIEKTVPTGYNKAADSTFTIAAHSYVSANLEQTSTVVNNAGSVLPSTGGIGTTIFYVVGSVLVIAAGILLITKKRMGRE